LKARGDTLGFRPWLNTLVILTLGFLLVFAPMGFLLRLCGQDPMQRQLELAAASYRVGRCESFESFSMIAAQGSALAPFTYTLF
jgi:saxitoxin biosynthesis operon SxtJ-like protein